MADIKQRKPLHENNKAKDLLINKSLNTSSDASKNKEASSTKAVVLLLIIFFASSLVLAGIYLSFPELEKNEKDFIKIPKDIDDAKNLGKVLSRYKDRYYYRVLGGYFLTYIFLQTFAIPGSIFLSILSGFLFAFPVALFLVCLCSATGASFCYTISHFVAGPILKRFIYDRVQNWSHQVSHHRDHIFYYILFLRITPFLPNWFINLASPIINVSITPFFWATFFGVAPPSFVAIQAGRQIYSLTSSSDAITFSSVLLLTVFAIISLLPIFFKNRLKQSIS